MPSLPCARLLPLTLLVALSGACAPAVLPPTWTPTPVPSATITLAAVGTLPPTWTPTPVPPSATPDPTWTPLASPPAAPTPDAASACATLDVQAPPEGGTLRPGTPLLLAFGADAPGGTLDVRVRHQATGRGWGARVGAGGGMILLDVPRAQLGLAGPYTWRVALLLNGAPACTRSGTVLLAARPAQTTLPITVPAPEATP